MAFFKIRSEKARTVPKIDSDLTIHNTQSTNQAKRTMHDTALCCVFARILIGDLNILAVMYLLVGSNNKKWVKDLDAYEILDNNFFWYFCDMKFHILIWKCITQTSVMQKEIKMAGQKVENVMLR